MDEVNITIKIDKNSTINVSISIGSPAYATAAIQASSIDAAMKAMEALKKLVPVKK
jgi:hypothetical protein